MRRAAFLVLLLAGCADPRLPDQLVEGKHVRYHSWKDMGPPCPEAIAQMDRFIEQLGAKVNRPAPADFRVDYYRVRDLAAVQELCGVDQAAACAIENKVYSTEWTHDHELVHAFLNRFASPPMVFLEGAAVIFGCGPARFSGEPRVPVDLASLLDNETWKSRVNEWNYSAAGAFSRWLVDRYGLETFIRFYESTPYKSSRDELNAKFRSAFGVELADALSEWQAEPISREGEFCLPVEDACDGAPELSAAEPGTSGSSTSDVTCVDRVSILEVGAAPVTRLRFTASQPGTVFRLRRCDSTGSRGGQFGAVEGKWNDLWSMLRPGRYSITVDAASPGDTSSIELEAHGPVFGDSCSLEPITVPDDDWSVRFVTDDGAAGGTAGVLRFEAQSERVVTGLGGSGFSGGVQMCSPCTLPPDRCWTAEPGTSNPGWLRGPTSFHFPYREAYFSVVLGLSP